MTVPRAELAEILAAVVRGRVSAAEISDATPLVGGGLGLESTEVLELVVAIEERLGVELRAPDLVEENLRDFASLAAMVTARMAR